MLQARDTAVFAVRFARTSCSSAVAQAVGGGLRLAIPGRPQPQLWPAAHAAPRLLQLRLWFRRKLFAREPGTLGVLPLAL